MPKPNYNTLILILLSIPVGLFASPTAPASSLLQEPSSSPSFPNPQTDPDACHGDVNTTNRVCDVDGLLGLAQMRDIQRDIVEYETLNVTCHHDDDDDDVFSVQLAVYVTDTMNARAGTDLAGLARQNAERIHNEWGVGYATPDCGGTGVLIFVALGDHQIYISRGKAVRHVLNDNRLQYIIDRMKPDLRDHRYGPALELGIHLLTEFMMGRRPGYEESKQGLLTFLIVIGAFGTIVKLASWGKDVRQRKQRRLRDQFREDLGKLDRDRARALQGQYKATSCPICLEDFSNKPKKDVEKQVLLESNVHADSAEEVYGSDGKPVHLLSCGHVFDQKCWDEFACYPAHTRDSTTGGVCCPVCRQPVTLDPSSQTATTRPLLDDQDYQDERRFRLQRLQHRYPTFVGTQYVDQWYDPYYRGSMLDDYDRLERERLAEEARRAAERAAHQRAHGGGQTTSSGFGGGSADGGGVGGSW